MGEVEAEFEIAGKAGISSLGVGMDHPTVRADEAGERPGVGVGLVEGRSGLSGEMRRRKIDEVLEGWHSAGIFDDRRDRREEPTLGRREFVLVAIAAPGIEAEFNAALGEEIKVEYSAMAGGSKRIPTKGRRCSSSKSVTQKPAPAMPLRWKSDLIL
jgi:hypothetical protein